MSIGTEKAEKIIRTYSDMIYRIALHNVESSYDAEDILQEVAVKLLTKCPDGDDEHIKAWLIRVTINQCRSFHRLFWQQRRESLDDHADLPAPEPPAVMEELRQLPKDQRNIIYLYYYEEYTITEIADILGKNANTVSSSLQRARKRLRIILSEGENHHEEKSIH